MKFTLFIRCCGPCFALCLLLAACASPVVEFEPYYWDPGLNAKAKLVEEVLGVQLEDTIDFEDDLGVDDDSFFGGRVRLFTGDNSWLRFDYLPVRYDSNVTTDRLIIFNGKPILPNQPVDTDFSMDYFRLGWAWQFVDIEDGFFKAGPLVELKGFFLDAEVYSPGTFITSPVNESESLDFVLPTVGAVVDVQPIEELNLYGEISGMTAGKYGFAYDAEAGLKFIPIDNVTVSAGLRLIALEAELHDDEVEIDLSGPFLAVSVRF